MWALPKLTNKRLGAAMIQYVAGRKPPHLRTKEHSCEQWETGWPD